MFDRFYLPALLIGLLVQIFARYADGAGWIAASTREILYGLSLACFALGLFLLGRIIGKILLNKVRHKI